MYCTAALGAVLCYVRVVWLQQHSTLGYSVIPFASGESWHPMVSSQALDAGNVIISNTRQRSLAHSRQLWLRQPL